MPEQKNLFADFSKTVLKDWEEKISKDLKGKPLESLQSLSSDGITIKPVYNHENTSISDQPFKSNTKWDTVQELFVDDPSKGNKEALDHLNRGATSLLFYLYGDCDLEALLKDIQIEFIRINFVVEGSALGLAQNFLTIIEKRGLNPNEIAGSINIDCLESLARTGSWLSSEDDDFDRVAALYEVLPENLKGLCINTNLFANAGATLAQQLGISLSMMYEYIHRLQLGHTSGFWINFAIGSDYFGEIAKLRAFRRLHSTLEQELGLLETEIHIYAETALRNKTMADRYNNMIRSTSEAMAAVIGGANEVSVKGFNHTYKEPDSFGERIAKNQLSMLEHESHFNAVNDLSKGSYFIENLTEELAQKGWEFFKDLEAQGGFVEAMKSGWLQEQVQASAEAEQTAFDTQTKTLIGANKFAQKDESLADFVEYGMFSSPDAEGEVVRKIVPKRLSEELELDLINNG